MIAEKEGSSGGEPALAQRWSEHLEKLHARIARRLRRPEHQYDDNEVARRIRHALGEL